MRFAAAVSRRENTDEAARQLVDSIQHQMPGEIDLLTVFLTYHHREDALSLIAHLRHDLSPRVLIGCTCEGVIGGDEEIERKPGISVLAGRLPGVTITPFHIGEDEWDDLVGPDTEESLRRRVGAIGDQAQQTRAFLLFGDPFTVSAPGIVALMHALDRLTPGAPTLGGMASGASQPGQNVLALDGHDLDEGVVGVRLAGNLRLETVVSQGCRPIGETLLVTRAEGNLIGSLGGKPALEVTRGILQSLTAQEQQLAQNGLYLGIVINEYQVAFDHGDFLVASVLGADQDHAVVITNFVRPGQTVQFHVRDAATADEDLRLLMMRAAQDETAPTGGLIFSCNGRGVNMFDLPNHDVRGVLEACPETPLAGFFATGELGPVGGKSFLHSHTASILLFRPEENRP